MTISGSHIVSSCWHQHQWPVNHINKPHFLTHKPPHRTWILSEFAIFFAKARLCNSYFQYPHSPFFVHIRFYRFVEGCLSVALVQYCVVISSYSKAFIFIRDVFLLCGSTDLLRTVSCLSLGIIVKNSSLLSFHLLQAFIVLVRFLLGRCYCFVISPVTEFYLGKSNKCHLL